MFDLSTRHLTLKSKFLRLCWNLVNFFFVKFSPVHLHRWRIFILRQFGAQIPYDCWVYPSVSIWEPSNLVMGSKSTLGRDVTIYNCAEIKIGRHTTISQRTTLCTGTHTPKSSELSLNPSMELKVAPIIVGNCCWITTEVFVHPGVEIGNNVVVGARSVVLNDLESDWTYGGFPAKKLSKRMD